MKSRFLLIGVVLCSFALIATQAQAPARGGAAAPAKLDANMA